MYCPVKLDSKEATVYYSFTSYSNLADESLRNSLQEINVLRSLYKKSSKLEINDSPLHILTFLQNN